MTQTILDPLRYEARPVKGSRFIVDIAPVSDEDDARALLARVATDFADASHHCWAWRLARPAIDRAGDDGEPSGSAGRPILAQLLGRDLVDAAVIVTRYFGGTKLGVGGLVRAYGGAAGEALDSARLGPWFLTTDLSFEHHYTHTDLVDRIVGEHRAAITGRRFGAMVEVDVRLALEAVPGFVTALANATAGAIRLDL